MIGLFPDLDADKQYLSRNDPDEILGTFSSHPFLLEETIWSTVEHYIQASKYLDTDARERISHADTPDLAQKIGESIWRRLKVRRDWKQVRETFMTRGIYTKCKAHPEVAEALLATGDTYLLENSQYDYFWGCGRDRRGNNRFGAVLMNVRQRLRNEQQENASNS